MDLAYVKKQAEDKNGVKYPLVRLFVRVVYAQGIKREHSQEITRVFLTTIRKKIDPLKFGSTEEQNLQESLEKYAKLKEHKFTLQ